MSSVQDKIYVISKAGEKPVAGAQPLWGTQTRGHQGEFSHPHEVLALGRVSWATWGKWG